MPLSVGSWPAFRASQAMTEDEPAFGMPAWMTIFPMLGQRF
jgi:hypothetical protein